MCTIDGRGLDPRTVDEFRIALWSFVEFVGWDKPVWELAENTPEQFLHWLRSMPIAPRKRSKIAIRQTSFDARGVIRFFDWLGWRSGPRGMRSEATVRKYWRHIAPFFEFLDPRYRSEKLLSAMRKNGQRMAADGKASRRVHGEAEK